MTRSLASPGSWLRRGGGTVPRPVAVGRYRYSKLRWRIAVHLIDMLGHILMRLWRVWRPPALAATPSKILVVQLDHLGDALLTGPMLDRLRAAYPLSRIDVLASPSNHEVFLANPGVDRVRVATRNWFERRRRGPMLSAVWSLGRSLRGSGYDLGIDVRGDILTVLVLSLAGIPRRVGWSMGGGGFLLTDVADWEPGRHEVPSRLALLGCLGIRAEAHPPPRVRIHVDDSDRDEIDRRLAEAWPPLGRGRVPSTLDALAIRPGASGGVPPGPAVRPRSAREGGRIDHDAPIEEAPLLAVHLGAGTEAKRWPRRHWAQLVGRFLSDGWRVVLVGGPEDADLAASMPDHPDQLDWTGMLSVTETAALLARADLFIGADSGPSHLAACAGTPSVVLFSGTNQAAQWRPWSRRSLILKNPVACRPCHRKVCPLADHPCMTGLDPDRVYRTARRWWGRVRRGGGSHGTT